MSFENLNSLYEEIKEVSQLLCERGWAEKNAGNLSVDITDAMRERQRNKDKFPIELRRRFTYLRERVFLITPSGSKFRDIAKSPKEILMLIKMSRDGKGYYILSKNPDQRPTSEVITHLRIQNYLRESNSDAKVVLHTHPTDLIAISHIREFQSTERLSNILISAHPEVFIYLRNKIGFVKYILTGSERLADATLRYVKQGKSIIVWERHGAIAIEKDLTSAFDHLDIANKAAEISLWLFSANKRPIMLNKEEMRELKSIS
ncbi:MAG: rhamnulose-1-phosphate aldolase [Myxococcota bacterium]